MSGEAAGTSSAPDAEVSSNFADKTLICKDCESEWIFSAGEQEFYAMKALENEPARCKECRKVKKNARFNARKQRAKGSGERGAAGGASGERPPRSTVCFKFQKGECTKGDACRYEHTIMAPEAGAV